ncbi:GGDEF domain-containing protein [Hypericibacter terrae]|uniref:diguanylate cyclase n=1 Tax=Hypericibacter terrae TaxID=2602015 RepID=A0A5J6MK22_9PROT|nr:diguanylate cyclase [Hypericibacter terrae]QEX17828.1 GGDEF domain-containing protein [Hypericibacter terrae]
MAQKHRSLAIVVPFFVGIVLLAAMAGSALVLGIDVGRKSEEVRGLETEAVQTEAALLALVDAETGFRGYALTADAGYLEPYYQGLERLRAIEAASPSMFAIDVETDGATLRFADLVAHRLALFEQGIADIKQNGPLTGGRLDVVSQGKQVMDGIRKLVGELRAHRRADIAALSGDLAFRNMLAFGLVTAAGIIAIALSIAQFFAFNRQMRRRETSEAALQLRSREIELAADMTNALQAVPTREESLLVIADYSSQIVADMTGALYTYNNARDQLVLSASWGNPALKGELVESFGPDQCWALRRGTAYIAHSARHGLNCQHVHGVPHSYMCVPIAAQGAVYGVLHLASPAATPEIAFSGIQDTARGLANRLSLALANMDLREKLRSLAIRDPLTGLFNRRVLDEILTRELARADRARSRLGVAMIDIDHFKSFNDQFGHKAGDIVLKSVCDQIAKMLRRSDLACRYGGEEIVVLLPDIDVENGVRVCEKLREGVASIELGELVPGATHVTVSIGFSLYPDRCSDHGDLLPSADRAMYDAKRAGRNRVSAYGGPAPKPDLPLDIAQPRLETIGSTPT